MKVSPPLVDSANFGDPVQGAGQLKLRAWLRRRTPSLGEELGAEIQNAVALLVARRVVFRTAFRSEHLLGMARGPGFPTTFVGCLCLKSDAFYQVAINRDMCGKISKDPTVFRRRRKKKVYRKTVSAFAAQKSSPQSARVPG